MLYYYTLEVPKTIPDLDPDLCQNFTFFITYPSLHVDTCVIPCWKAAIEGFVLII